MRDDLCEELKTKYLCATTDSGSEWSDGVVRQEFGAIFNDVVIVFAYEFIELINTLDLNDYVTVDYADPNCMDIAKLWVVSHRCDDNL